jgi:hypothetical protein
MAGLIPHLTRPPLRGRARSAKAKSVKTNNKSHHGKGRAE